MKPWVVPVTRAEGVFFLFLAWRSDETYSAFKRFLGLFGLLALASPRRVVDSATEMAYTDAARCQWCGWVYPLARLVGALYVLVAVDALRRD